MFNHYHTTQLEQYVEDLYIRIGITEPQQLTIDELSQRLNIWVYYENIRSRAIDSATGMCSMFIDNRLLPQLQWLEFLHELCHLLRHAGNQTIMPSSFLEAQEEEADRFAMYASVPFSILSRLPVPDRRSEAIAYIADEFRIPPDIAEKRLEQIQRKVLQGTLIAAAQEQEKPQPSGWSAETNRLLIQLHKQKLKGD